MTGLGHSSEFAGERVVDMWGAGSRLPDRVERRHGIKPRIIAADAGYGTGDFLCGAEQRGITPHAAMSRQATKGDSERHRARRRMRRRHASRSYRVSQRVRRLIEPVIGWCKDVGGLLERRGRWHVGGHDAAPRRSRRSPR